jgi:hypothetical protein
MTEIDTKKSMGYGFQEQSQATRKYKIRKGKKTLFKTRVDVEGDN